MIEFTPDGPFAEKADQLFPNRVRVIGLGQTGAAVCDQLVLHGRPAQDLWIFDSDQANIDSSVVPNRHLLGQTVVHGLGCSGDISLAREIVAQEDAKLAPVALGCDFLVLVVGLAGATGVAAAERLIELAHDAKAKVIIVGVQPFAFEGSAKRERAVEAIADLRRDADSVLVLAHDRIADSPAAMKNVRHGFHLMHQLMASITQALSQIVCKRGLIQLSFADVRSLYGRYAGSEVLENCWAAHVEGDIHDRTEDLVAQLLSSPMLADESVWNRIDHAIVTVSGTRDLGLSDVQEMVTAFKDRLAVDIPISTSASLDEESHDRVRMTVLLATTAPARMSAPELAAANEKAAAKKVRPIAETVPMPKASPPKPEHAPESMPTLAADPAVVKVTRRKAPPKPAAPPVTVENHTVTDEELLPAEAELGPVPTPVKPTRRYLAKQEEMSFEGPPRGRFEKTHETMYRGENLDQPTYRRRGLKIRI